MEELVSRRTLVAARPGGAVFLASWLNAVEQSDYGPKFFAPDEFAALRAFSEILIPSDEFPGAREARWYNISFPACNHAEHQTV